MAGIILNWSFKLTGRGVKICSVNRIGLNKTIQRVILVIFPALVYLADNHANNFLKDSINLTIYEDSARFYNNLGREYSLNGNYKKAEYNFKKTLELVQKYFQHDLKIIATSLRNLGANYYLQWMFDDALRYYKLAEDIYMSDLDKYETELGILAINKGLLLTNTGDNHNAKFHFEIALKYFSNGNSTSIKNYMTYLYNSLGVVSFRLKDYTKAITYYNECISLSKTYNQDMIPICFESLALVYNEMTGFEEKSEYYFKCAVDFYLKNKSAKYYKLAHLYSNYADFLLEEKKFGQSRNYYIKALKISKNNNETLHPSTANTYLGLGDVYLKMQQPDSALIYYQKAISSLIPGFNDKDLYSDPEIDQSISKIHLLKCLKHRASAYLHYYYKTNSRNDLIASLNSYDLAIRLIDQIRLGYQDQDSKLYLSENEKSTYNEALYTAEKLWRLTSKSHYRDKAFEYSERSKSALLLAAIRDAGAKGFGGIPDELLKEEKELVRDIAFYKEQIYEESRKKLPDKAKLDLWEKTLYNLTNQNDKLIKQLELEYPKYHTLKYNTNVTGINDAGKKLAGDCALLEYMLTDSILYIFVVKKNFSQLITRQVDSLFYQSLQSLLKSIKQVDITNHNFSDYVAFHNSSSTLYNYLIVPVKEYIKSKHLIIIPDDILAFLPFEVLIKNGGTAEINNPDYRKLNYLIKDYSVSYAYSSTMLFENQWKVQKRAVRNLLAFAPAYHGADGLSMRGNSRNGYRKNLAPIPGAKEEVEKIMQLTAGHSFVGEAATELNFKTNAGDYDILHLAMHTIIDDQNPMFSKLVFSLSKDSSEDGFLNTYEIFNLNLNARLAILSSCGSGEGLLKKGEGVVSLARGFAYAGCPGLLITLWEIEDKTGIGMMVNFYRNIKRGYQKDVALQKAKVEFIESGNHVLAHPFFWSSFISIGDQSPLYFPLRKPLLLFIPVVLIAGIIFIIFKKYRKKQFNSRL